MTSPFDQNSPQETLPAVSSFLYNKGWIFGTGGSASLRIENEIFLTPKNLMPNQIQADHIFVHESEDNSKIKGPEKMEANQGSNIMAAIYQKLEEANAIIHSMDKKSLVYCAIFHGDEFRVRNHAMILEIIKTKDKEAELVIPILNNAIGDADDEEETKLSEKIKASLAAHPLAPAVLIRGRGLFVWAENINDCILKTEAIHQVLDYALEFRKITKAPGFRRRDSMNHTATSTPQPTPKTPNTPMNRSRSTPNSSNKSKNNSSQFNGSVKNGRVVKKYAGNGPSNKNTGNGSFNRSGHNTSGGGKTWQNNKANNKANNKKKPNNQPKGQNMEVLMNY